MTKIEKVALLMRFLQYDDLDVMKLIAWQQFSYYAPFEDWYIEKLINQIMTGSETCYWEALRDYK